MLARAAFPSFLLTLSGFILFLLVTLSVPIIKTIYLLQIRSGDSSVANIGVLGTCRGDVARNAFDFVGTAQCTDPRVGYTIPSDFFGVNVGNRAARVVAKGLAGSLIINAIAAGTAGISLFFAFFAWFCASRAMEIVLFITLFFSSFAAWIAFWLNLALVLVAHKRIEDYTSDTLSGHIGNGLWMSLAGAIALTIAICFAGCGMFGRYSDRRTHTPRNGGEKGYGGGYRFWRRNRTNATY